MLTLDLSPEAEQALVEGARRRGVSLETYLESLVVTDAPISPRALLGKYAHLPVSSESVLRTRREEVQHELGREANS